MNKERTALHIATLEQWVRHHPKEAKELKDILVENLEKIKEQDRIEDDPSWED